MPEKDIDLERAVQDPVYRRQVIERLNAEAERQPENRVKASPDTGKPIEEAPARH